MAKLLIILAAVLVIAQASSMEREVHGGRIDDEVRILKEMFLDKDTIKRDLLRLIRPPGDVTDVEVDLRVDRILSFCEKTHQWKLQLVFRQKWNDKRLTFTLNDPKVRFLTLTVRKIKDYIWIPHLFLPDKVEIMDNNEKMHESILTRIHPNGDVLLSRRFTCVFICPVSDFKRNEFTCPIRIGTYGHTKDEVNLKWRHEKPVKMNEHNEKENKVLLLQRFGLHNVETKTCERTSRLGTFSCIVANFKFGNKGCEHTGMESEE